MNLIKIDASNFEEMWGQLCEDAGYLYPLYEKMNLAFYEAYAHESKFTDCSLVVEEQSMPLLGIRMTVRERPDGSKELTCFDRPLLYLESPKGDENKYKNAHKIFKAEFDRVMAENDISKVISRDLLFGNQLSFLSQHLLDIGAVASPYFARIIDLTPPEEKLCKEIRKSYKSLINWGKGNLVMFYEDGDSVKEESMERFRQLHIQAAGQETRSQETWRLQYEMVRQGEAFLILGELDEELVTAALFPCTSMHCVYGVSASNRDMFDKPLSHAMLWNGMLYAKKVGCSFFEMGKLQFPQQGNPAPSQKELGISTFKRGFGGQAQSRLDVIWKK